jgi:5-formyltetrahydrofolate cyclo-ligase
MTDAPAHVTKKVLRDTARHKRSLLIASQIRENSRKIATRVADSLGDIEPVMVYVSKPLEVGTQEILDDLICRKKKVVVPIIQQETRTLRLSCLTDTSCLVASTFQVMEPIGNEIPAHPRDVKAVIVPMLAFDRSGHRLGYGAGYYDRFLESNPHLLKIGLAFSCQEAQSLPSDAHDIRMDIIITEDEVIDCRDH